MTGLVATTADDRDDTRGAYLSCWTAGSQFHRWDLHGSAVTIGRAMTADIRLLDDPLVSRVHSTLERVAGAWTVADEGLSRNGTFVNGRRLTGRLTLHDGDEIRVGGTMLVFRSPEEAGTSTVVADPLLTPARLTPAQRAVLVALCRPYAEGGVCAAPATNQAIADELFLSLDTVKSHLRALFLKLDLEHLPQNQKRLRLVDLALRHGLVSLHEIGLR